MVVPDKVLIAIPTTLFGNLNLSSKQSEVNAVDNPDIEIGCCTDLISSVEYVITDLIDLGKSNPLIINFSPTENVPEVCFNLIMEESPPATTANPLAPLLLPFTYDVAGNSVLEIA